MSLHGTVSALRGQLINSPKFSAALDYLEKAVTSGTEENERIMAVPVGEMRRVDVAPGVFALEQAYVGKARREGRFEAHNRHIDLQAIVAGPERMDVTARSGLTPNDDQLEANDVCFFEDVSGASVWAVRSGEVAVFFPTDAHMPSLHTGTPVVIQKTCIKVEID
ncbi:MAG: hypothetical protein SynsKO_44540 [Synoicihabitans sp.]